MANRIFTDEMIDLLSTPSRWRIISSLFPSEVAPARQDDHAQWIEDHSHRHAYQEVVIGLRGQSWHGFRGEVYPIGPGTILAFDAFESHDYGYPPWTPAIDQLWIATFAHHLYVRYVTVRGTPAAESNRPWLFTLGEVGLLGQQLLFNRHGQEHLPLKTRRFGFCAGLGAVLTHCIRQGYAECPAQDDAEHFQQRIISTVQQHLDETAGRGVTLDTLAELSGYSKFHFSRLFKQYTGQSVHEYIDSRRIKKVHEMEAKGYAKRAIAQELGFVNTSTFTRWYKQWKSAQAREVHYSFD